MNTEQPIEAAAPSADEALGSDGSSLLRLAVLTLLAGAVSGLVAALFRLLLQQAGELRDWMISIAHGVPVGGFFLVVGATALLALVAAWLVRRFSPHAAGSGIPHVEAVLHGVISPAGYALGLVKFVGGLLALGGGLVLGREGPSVQMGAAASFWVGRLFGCKWGDCRVLLAAGAGAGLATAFNAPIALTRPSSEYSWSFAAPPSRTSLPAPPSSVSASSSPRKVSLPAPPSSESVPVPPSIVSLPSPP